MRTIRALTVAAAVMTALPTIAQAQGGRGFKDAWFWGLKGGGYSLADSGQNYVQAPTVGVEWLITRTRGGLYISGAQTFFSQHAFTLRDPLAPIDSGLRPIAIKNMRRVDVALMGFPGEHIRFHPYVGAGMSLMQIASASPDGEFANEEQLLYTAAVIQEERVAFSPFFIAGGQYRFRTLSVFGQLTASPAQKNFLAYNGKSFNFGYEIGIRYNVGTSISKD
jgi:hypothetical protein